MMKTMKGKKSISQILYEVEWREVLREAIKIRPASWCDNPVREWRNEGDTIMCAIMMKLKEKGVIKY